MIAQTNPGSRVIFWCVVLLLVSIAAAALVFWIRRRMLQDDYPTVSTGFSLADFREMHQRGELSDEEFEAARARLIAAHREVDSLDAGGEIGSEIAETAQTAEVTDNVDGDEELDVDSSDADQDGGTDSDPDKNPPDRTP